MYNLGNSHKDDTCCLYFIQKYLPCNANTFQTYTKLLF